MSKLETVKVESDNESGYIVINKSDMTKNHKEFTEETVKVESDKKPAVKAKAK